MNRFGAKFVPVFRCEGCQPPGSILLSCLIPILGSSQDLVSAAASTANDCGNRIANSMIVGAIDWIRVGASTAPGSILC